MSDLKIAVYDLKQAEQMDGKFDKNFSRVIDLRKVSTEFAKVHNDNFEFSGSYYELNKSENDKFKKIAKEKLEKIAKKAELEKAK